MATKSTARKTSGGATRKKKTASKKKTAAPKKKAAAKSAKKAPKSAAKKSASSGAKKKTSRTASSGSRRAPAAKTGTRSARKKASSRKTPKPVRARDVEKKYRHLGDALMRKQAELMQAYASAKNDTRDRLDDGTEDYIDYAVNSYAKDFMLSLTELERQQLQLVREAIYRLNRGEYGECLQCGVEIPMKRLEVSPWVRYCIQCQELEDQGLLTEPSFPGLDDESSAFDDDADDEPESDDDSEDDGDDDSDDDLASDDDDDDADDDDED